MVICNEGKEFYGQVIKLMKKHNVIMQQRRPSVNIESQGIVERFNRTLADRLFSYQYHKEFEEPSQKQ